MVVVCLKILDSLKVGPWKKRKSRNRVFLIRGILENYHISVFRNLNGVFSVISDTLPSSILTNTSVSKIWFGASAWYAIHICFSDVYIYLAHRNKITPIRSIYQSVSPKCLVHNGFLPSQQSDAGTQTLAYKTLPPLWIDTSWIWHTQKSFHCWIWSHISDTPHAVEFRQLQHHTNRFCFGWF